MAMTVKGLSASMVLQVCSGSRRFVKTEFFFKAGEQPDNYQQVRSLLLNVLHSAVEALL